MEKKTDFHDISELTGNITLQIIGNDNEISLTSEVVEGSKEGYVNVLPITYNEKIVSFKSVSVGVIITGTVDGMKIFFNANSIILVKDKNGSLCHRIYCRNKSKCVNRREYKRFSLGCDGVAKIGSKLKAPCTVRNVSYGGLAIEMCGKLQIPVDLVLEVCVCPSEKDKFNVSGVAVRSEYNEQKNETNIGIKVTSNSPQLRSLVTQVQRNELKKINHDNNLL